MLRGGRSDLASAIALMGHAHLLETKRGLFTPASSAAWSATGTHVGEAGVYWKYWAWVYERDTGCRAQVEQSMLDERCGRLLVRIQGQRHERLVKWLRERIQQRNRE